MRIWGLGRLAALGLALALVGCVTTAENSLSQEDIAGMKLTGVTVSFDPNAQVQWEEGLRAYAAAKAIPADQLAAAEGAPDARAYARTMLASKIKAGLEEAMAGQLNGSRPVRLQVTVKQFVVSTAGEQILIGRDHEMLAAADLVDARTGATIISNPNVHGFLMVKGGLIATAVSAAMEHAFTKSLTERLIAEYGRVYKTWLIRSA